MNVNYELLWKQLKDDIIWDLKALADPGTELDSSVAFRIAGE